MRATSTTDGAADSGFTRPAEISRFQPKSPVSLSTEAFSVQKRKDPQISKETEGVYDSSELKAVGLEPTTYGLKVRGKHRENKGFLSSVAPKVATDMADDDCERLISLAETDPETKATRVPKQRSRRGSSGGSSSPKNDRGEPVGQSLPIKADSFSAALAMIASLPLSDAEKADAVRRLMAEQGREKP